MKLIFQSRINDKGYRIFNPKDKLWLGELCKNAKGNWFLSLILLFICI